MDPPRSVRAPETPRRTPGKSDFKRPKFALGRISFGPDDDGSNGSSSSSSSYGEQGAAMAPSPLGDAGSRGALLGAGTGKSNSNLAGPRGAGAGRSSRDSGGAGAAFSSSKRASAASSDSTLLPLPSARKPTALQDSSSAGNIGNIGKAAANGRGGAMSAKGHPAAGAAASSSSGAVSGVLAGWSLGENNRLEKASRRQQQQQQKSRVSPCTSISPVGSNARPAPAQQSRCRATAGGEEEEEKEEEEEGDIAGYQGRRVRRRSHGEESRPRHTPASGGQGAGRRRKDSSALTFSGGGADTSAAEVHTLDDDDDDNDDGDGGGGDGNHQENIPPYSRTGRDSSGGGGAAAAAATEASATAATGTGLYNSSRNSSSSTRTGSSPPRGFDGASAFSDGYEEIIEIPIDDVEMLPFFDDGVDDGVDDYSPPPREDTNPSATVRASPSCQGSGGSSRSSRARQSTSSFASAAGSSVFNRSMSPPPAPFGRNSKIDSSSNSSSSSLSVPARDSASGGGVADNISNSSDVFADCLDLTGDPADSSADCLDLTLDPEEDSSADGTRQQADGAQLLGQAPTLSGKGGKGAGASSSAAAGGHASGDALDAERGCAFVGSRPSSGSGGGGGAGRLDRRRPGERGGGGGGGGGGGEAGGKRRGGGAGGGVRRGSSSTLDVTGGDSSDDNFVMTVSPPPRGVTEGATSSPVAATDRYSKPGVAGDWERGAGGLTWNMEAGGSEGEDSSAETFSVPSELYTRMYPHQRIGIRWLWGLHQGDMGGILGDDMGLGKTFQVACFLAGLFSTSQASCALVVCPKSVIRGWETELSRWLVEATCRKAQVFVLSSEMPAKARRSAIARAVVGGLLGKGAVVITTYGMVAANPKQFAPQGRQRKWDYVILDEGHKIKNSSTKTCEAVHSLPARRRLLLTGTPVQNNLRELHTVVDWATFGGLLGAYPDFKRNFSRPIEQGQYGDASEYMVQKSRTRAAELRTLLEPFLLQRTKAEIMDLKATSKTEMVVWVALSPPQREVYAAYLGGENVKDVLNGKVASPLAAISHLKKVCLHPVVSSFMQGQPWVLDPDVSVRSLLRDSSKLSVMLQIVREACGRGHRVLVFSRFVRMLDVIQRCIEASTSEGGAGFRLSRIDGSHSDLERQSTIKSFNGDENIKVCLVSTGAGGTGITLTGADRVILFDPSWNPADDMQAVDRAYRIGQTRDVIVYRMIAAGTVEEKMYEKQVFKDGLRRTIMGGSGKRKKNVRYFSRAELKQLFTLFPVGECRVLDRLEEMHGTLKDRLEAADSPTQQEISLDGHLEFVCGLRGSYGASAHGDGLPKIAQHTGGAGADGSGVVIGRNGERQGPRIAEEEDESDVEDSEDDMRADRGRVGRATGRARSNVLEMEGLEEGGLEIDLDESDGDDSGYVHDMGADPPVVNAGGEAVAAVVADDDSGRRRREAGKGKGKDNRHRRLLRAGSSDDSESNDENVVVVEGDRPPRSGRDGGSGKGNVRSHDKGAGAGAGGDDSMTGADASTAIELDVGSESEMELGFGDNKGDIVDLLDNDNYGGDGGWAWSPMPSPHQPAVNDASVEGFGTPGSQPMSPPGSNRSWARDGAETSASMSGGDIAPITAGLSSPVRSEPVYVKEEGGSGVGMLGASPPAASSPPPTSRPLASPSGEEGIAFTSSPKEAPAVQAGRERARRWACDALGLSPIASASPSSCRGTGGEDTDEDEREQGDGRRGGADADRIKIGAPASEVPGMVENGSRSTSFGGETLEGLNLGEGELLTEGDSDASLAARLRGERETALKGDKEEEGEEEEGQQPRGRKRFGQAASRVIGSDVDEQEESEDAGSIASAMVSRCSVPGSPRPDESLNRWDSPAASFASSDESMVGNQRRPGVSPPTPATTAAETREEETGSSVASATVSRCSLLEPPRLDASLSSRWDSPAASFASSDESMVGDLKRPVAAPRTNVKEEAETRATAGEQGVGSSSSLTPPEGGKVETKPARRPLSDSAWSFTTPGKSDRLPSPDRLVHEGAGAVSGESFGPQHSGCSGYETAESAQDVGPADVLTLEGRGDSTPVADTSGSILGRSGSSASHDGRLGEHERGQASSVGNDVEGACEQARKDEDRRVDISEERGGVVEPTLGSLSPTPSASASPPPLPKRRSDSATVCATHKAAADRASYKCLRCSCFAGAQGAEQAQVLLLAAWEQERAGDMHQAVGTCLEAIKLCDEDRELHKTIARIGSRLGWFASRAEVCD